MPGVSLQNTLSPNHEWAQKLYSELVGWRVAADRSIGAYEPVDTAADEGAIGVGIDPSESCATAIAGQRPARRNAPTCQYPAMPPRLSGRLLIER